MFKTLPYLAESPAGSERQIRRGEDMKERFVPTIKEMPDKKTLEEFLAGNHSEPKVIFNHETGKFEWLEPKEKPKGGSVLWDYLYDDMVI